jgi:hypothetical protein
MIAGKFDSKTLAVMNLALDRVCEQTPRGEKHPVRKRIAKQIIRCARGGRTTLTDLICAGQHALDRVATAAK